jgi:protein-tyrosine phosphatase
MESSFTLARRLSRSIQGGKSLVIHCRAGIGRSSIIAANVLIMAGFSADTALDFIAVQHQRDIPDTQA